MPTLALACTQTHTCIVRLVHLTIYTIPKMLSYVDHHNVKNNLHNPQMLSNADYHNVKKCMYCSPAPLTGLPGLSEELRGVSLKRGIGFLGSAMAASAYYE